jgi:hypothetical protein
VVQSHIYVGGRRVADTYCESYLLWTHVALRGDAPPKRRIADCDPHPNALAAFVHVTQPYDVHWPIRFCPDCRLILAGRDPYPVLTTAAGRDPADVVASRWMKEWPKGGMPWRHTVPRSVEWPEAA